MIKFLIQTIDGEIKHDFSFTLLKSIEYQAWADKTSPFTYHLLDMPTKFDPVYCDYIPVGSVEFVSKFLFQIFGRTPKPRNVPVELFDKIFSGRTIINGTNEDITEASFVKSNDKIKYFAEFCSFAPAGNYQISSIIRNIDSEWRAFIYKGELVGLQNYSGNFTKFPDVRKINEMIRVYKSAPISYTLDVAICDYQTYVIEVHDFFSCGLYGFEDHKILPFMFSRWYQEYIRKQPY
jgi:hypothetical protein